jgi:PAS domain S-box-containing protein
MEYRVYASDGSVVWLRDETVLLHDADGEPTVWQGVMIDVTDAKAAEEKLRVAEGRYRSVVEHSPAALYMEDLDPGWVGTVYASPQVETITGYTPQAWVDDPDLWFKVTHPEDLPSVLEAERRCVESGEPFDMDVRMVRPDGSVVWVHDSAVLVRDDDGEPQFWLGFFHDITEKKHAEEELSRALNLERSSTERLRALDDMKDVFLTAVSHELRSPLAAIMGSARTLEMFGSDVGDDDRVGLVEMIIRKARRIQEIVDDLLDLERLRRGASTIERVPTDLAVVVAESLGASGLSDTHTVVTDLPPTVVGVDPTMVSRIADNLLSNAARYTPEGSCVWVSVRAIGDGAEIVVADDGPGVPEGQREALFEPFHQGPETVAHSPGVGIGLALVARFAELHGGHAWVDERRGGGAAFHVMLEGSRGSA